jgi:hypothetical protein
MKQFLSLILFIRIICLDSIAISQTCDCNKFRTGDFEITSPDGTISRIHRTETKQIEKNAHAKIIDRVVWIDRCSFKLVPISIKDKNEKIGADIINFTFIETFDHAYIVRITIEGKKDFEISAKVYERGYLDYDKFKK